MPIYIAKIKQKNTVRTVELQARTEQEARQIFEKQGRIVTFKRKAGLDFNFGMTPGERQIFFSRMSAMLRSRVGTSDALALIRDTFTGKIQEVAGRLLSHVEAGSDFSTAVERVGSPDFPEATIALIMAGSRSGETWRAIKDAAEFEMELHRVKSGASKGLMMGIGSLVFAGIVTIVSTGYVGPSIMESPMIAQSAKKGAVDIGWINTAGYVVSYLIGALLVIGFLAWLFAFIGRAVAPTATDKVILKVPFYKDLILSRNNFIVLYGLALLIRSGVRTEEALRLSAEGAPKGALRADLFGAMNAVKTGRQWPKEMATLHPTDKAALLSATDREQVATTLGALATQYRELYAQRLATFVPALNLLSALFMSIAGGILFGQAILPMLMASSGMF